MALATVRVAGRAETGAPSPSFSSIRRTRPFCFCGLRINVGGYAINMLCYTFSYIMHQAHATVLLLRRVRELGDICGHMM